MMLRFSVFGADMLRLIDDEQARRRAAAARERQTRSRDLRRRPVEARPSHHWVPAHLVAA
jgi:hypothetical protein